MRFDPSQATPGQHGRAKSTPRRPEIHSPDIATQRSNVRANVGTSFTSERGRKYSDVPRNIGVFLSGRAVGMVAVGGAVFLMSVAHLGCRSATVAEPPLTAQLAGDDVDAQMEFWHR